MAAFINIIAWLLKFITNVVASYFGSAAHKKIRAKKNSKTGNGNMPENLIRQFFFGPKARNSFEEFGLITISQDISTIRLPGDAAGGAESLSDLRDQAYNMFNSALSSGPRLTLINAQRAASKREKFLERHVIAFGSPEDNSFLHALYSEWNPNALIQYKNGKLLHRTMGEENQIIENIYPPNQKDESEFFYGGVFRFINYLGYARTLVISLDPEHLLAVIGALLCKIKNQKKCEEGSGMCGPGGTAIIIKGPKKSGTGGCLIVEVNQ